jgi:hypothetical protein
VKPPINPHTRVGAILDAHPELENALLEFSPHFKKLKNPILRRTVARVATLETAAATAGVNVADLVAHLRRAAGEDGVSVVGGTSVGDGTPVEDDTPDAPPASPTAERPTWVDEADIAHTLDADAMLARNEHPLGIVQSTVPRLAAHQAVHVRSSFRPEPLIELMLSKGCRVHVEHDPSDDTWSTWMAPPSAG